MDNFLVLIGVYVAFSSGVVAALLLAVLYRTLIKPRGTAPTPALAPPAHLDRCETAKPETRRDLEKGKERVDVGVNVSALCEACATQTVAETCVSFNFSVGEQEDTKVCFDSSEENEKENEPENEKEAERGIEVKIDLQSAEALPRIESGHSQTKHERGKNKNKTKLARLFSKHTLFPTKSECIIKTASDSSSAGAGAGAGASAGSGNIFKRLPLLKRSRGKPKVTESCVLHPRSSSDSSDDDASY